MKRDVIFPLFEIIESAIVWLSGENNLCEVDVTETNEDGVWGPGHQAGGVPSWVESPLTSCSFAHTLPLIVHIGKG